MEFCRKFIHSHVKKRSKKPVPPESADPSIEDPCTTQGRIIAPHERFFISLISVPPILDSVLSQSNPREIFRFSRTCHGARAAVIRYMRRAFNFESYFGVFFRDPLDFRRLLAQTGAVVSGLNALHYMARTGWMHEALDLYVNPNDTRTICEWLTSARVGYMFLPRSNQTTWQAALDAPLHRETDDYTSLASDLTHNLAFVTEEPGDDGYRVRVKVCGKPSQPISIIKTILGFDHSCLMNVITHHAAYSLYSSLTFREHLSYVFELTHGREVSMKRFRVLSGDAISFEKFSDDPLAGWRNPGFDTIRFVGDEYCWTIPHAPHVGIPTDDLITLNEWKVTTDYAIYKTHAHSLHVLGMKHGYTRHVGVPDSVIGKRTMIAVAQKLVLHAIDDGKEYRGDELDHQVYTVWQQLKDPRFANGYWQGDP